MLTDRPNIVLATAPKHSGRKKSANPPLNGPATVPARPATQQTSEPAPPPSEPPRIVQARKPGSKPYLSLNMPKAPPDPDADRKVKAFFRG